MAQVEARNVAGIADAQHAEYDPASGTLLVTPLACAVPDRDTGGPRLSGTLGVALTPGSLLARIYGQRTIDEAFTCSYGLNPAFQEALTAAGLRIAAMDEAGEVRAFELPDRRFFLATLFLPQRSSTIDRPHPLIVVYLEAALRFRDEERRPALSSPGGSDR